MRRVVAHLVGRRGRLRPRRHRRARIHRGRLVGRRASCEAYQKSKTLAEKAAWDFVAKLPARHGAWNWPPSIPGFVAGPLSGPEIGTSGEVVGRLMRRELPACPEIGWAIVDVRDVAIAHRLATETPEAAGQRFIAAGDHVWMQDIGRILAAEFGPQGLPSADRQAALPADVAGARFDKSVRLVLQYVGKREKVSHDKATRMLGWKPRPVKETFVDMANSMIEKGLIPAPKVAGRAGRPARRDVRAARRWVDEEVEVHGKADHGAV